MRDRGTGARFVKLAAIAAALTASVVVVPFATSASAAPAVVLTPSTGPYTNGQTITINGTGFPSNTADPSGLTIIQCSDPNGTTANLPTDNTTCDGTTANALPVNTNSSGSFSATYSIASLTTTGGASNINCDATHYCVLWIGVDFNNSFNGTHAFSNSFLVSSPVTSTPEAPLALALPLGAAVLIGGSIFLTRRRRTSPAA